jgi:putative hemolysin
MLGDVMTEIVIIVLLLLVNGVFAMSEIAVVTSRRVRLEQRAERGDKGAAAALAIAREPSQFLSTVQVGITLVGVLAGAFGGATLSEELAAGLTTIPRLAPYAEPLALALVVGAITYLSLIVGELVPKRIALGAPERIAATIARPMRLLARVTAPMVALLTGSTNLTLRLLGVRPHAEAGITEEEIRALVGQGAQSGVVQTTEHEIVESVFRLGDRSVRAIMTPRPDVEWIDLEDDEAETPLAAQLDATRRGLQLVADGDLDHVVGFVHAEDLLAHCLTGGRVDRATLRTSARPPLFVPASMPVFQLLETFRASRQQAAVVLDEYGGVTGVVTLHDVLEELVGDLPTPSEAEEGPPIVRRPDGSWLMDGSVPVGDVEAELDIVLTGDERDDFQTLAGFVLTRLGRLPRPSEHVTWHGHRFEVVALDGRRIEKVAVVREDPRA